MKLEDVIDLISVKSVSSTLDVDVLGVRYDSREVEAGDVFCALSVTAFDDETVNSGIDGFQGSLQRGNDVVNGQTGGFQRCCVFRR